jgi:hypothetical protein
MIQYPKRDRGGPSLAGYEAPHIYKDPPKSIFTRKKEMVNIADVQYMMQADNPAGDPTRINQAIKVFARGVNPMVEVDYGNGQGARNPYRVEVVRPPLMPLETLVPLSAPRSHQNYSISTNIGSNTVSAIGGDNLVDKNKVKNMVNQNITNGILRTNLSQDLSFGPVVDEQNVRNKITFDTLTGSLASNLSQQMNIGPVVDSQLTANKIYFDKSINSIVSTPGLSYISDEAEKRLRLSAEQSIDKTKMKDNLLKTLNTNFSSVMFFDPKNNTYIDIGGSIREKNYIAVNAQAGNPIVVSTADGKTIKLKDYTYSVVKPNIGNTQIVIQVKQPDIVLERNTPLYSMQTNTKMTLGYNEQLARANSDQYAKSDKFIGKISTFGEYEDRITKRNDDPFKFVPIGKGIRPSR